MLMSMICGARAFGDARAFRHPVRLAAGELHDVDAGALPFGAQHGIAAAFDQRVARGHLRDDEAGAELRHQPAERRIGDARHRRQHHAVPHRNVADAECGCPMPISSIVCRDSRSAYILGYMSICIEFSH